MVSLSSTTVVLSGLTGAALLRYLYDLWRRREGPPGPWGLPLVGYLLSLRPNMWMAGSYLRARYGDIVQIPTLPGEEIVLIQGFEAIHKTLVESGDLFNGRLRGLTKLKIFNPNHSGIALSMGPDSETLRRFSLRTLKNFGLGRAESERIILQEFEQLRAIFLSKAGREFDPRESVNKAVALVTCRFLFGDSAVYDTPQFARYLDAASTVLRYQLESSLLTEIIIRLPFLLRFLPDRWFSIKRVYTATQMLVQFNQSQADLHRSRMEEEGAPEEPGNYTEAFLLEERNPDSPKNLFNNTQLTWCLVDLFVAGSDTTTNTLLWSLLIMALHPDVQERVHTELLAVVGPGRNPSMRDRQATPFTDAVIHETLRYRPIAPQLLAHAPLNGADARLCGYKVPGNTPLVFSIVSVHRDPRYWARPNEFYPEHFLDPTGTKFLPSEHFIPFGIGRRACMGEALSRTEQYLFFSSIFLNFKVTLGESQTPGQVETALRGNMAGGVYAPLDFLVRVEPR